MVKEFQQLRKQMTQRLLEQQQQKMEMVALVEQQAKEKEIWLMDIIELIDKLSRKETIVVQTLQLDTPPKQVVEEIYNNIQNDLLLLLSKYGVQPIVGDEQFEQEKETGHPSTLDQPTSPRKRFRYQGKILKK